MIDPRPYQQDVIEGASELWRQGRRRIAAVLATGAGKTVIFSYIAGMARAAGRPSLVLAHRSELLDQAIAKLLDVNPDARVGRMQGQLKQYRAEIVVGSVATCATEGGLALLRSRDWGLIIVDEAHHVAAATYQRVLRELGAFTGTGPLVLGVTATLARGDKLALGDTFEDVVEPTVGLRDLIKQGYLVPPRGIRVKIAELDLGRVGKVAGDFNQGQLGAAMTASMAPLRIVEAWSEHAKGRPTVAFLPSVEVSKQQAEAFREAGYTAVHVDASSSDDEREGALRASAAGTLDVICNVNLFGEGTDMPWVSAVVLRMTMSPIVYTQQVGRGLRLFPGKTDCVIIDPAGVTGRHKLATLVNLDGVPDAEAIPDDLLMYEDEAEPDEPVLDLDDDPEPAAAPEYVDGDLAHELVDLFGESHSAWLRTAGGTWFLAAGPGYVYLAPGDTPGRYDLRWARDRAHTGVLQRDMEIGYAMAAGDEYVAQFPVWQTERSAAWRSKRVGRNDVLTRGEVHDAKAVTKASAVLDR